MTMQIKETKKVVQLTLAGEYIKLWNSCQEAADTLGINAGNICSCCNHYSTHHKAGSYRWEYLDNYNPDDVKKVVIRPNNRRRIQQIDKDGNIVRECDSLAEMVGKTGFNPSSVSECARGKRKVRSVHGFTFKYID